MLKRLRMLAPLALAGQLFAGGFFLQLGNPQATQEAQKTGAVLTVKATGCHDPAKAKLTATAIGLVNGERREVPLKVTPLSEAGMFAISRDWPREGKWVIQLVARNDEQFTNTLVAADASGVDRYRSRNDMRPFAAADIDAMLR